MVPIPMNARNVPTFAILQNVDKESISSKPGMNFKKSPSFFYDAILQDTGLMGIWSVIFL
jgi:hypothetical protein